MMGKWSMGVMNFLKVYGLYGLKHHIVVQEISGDVTNAGRQQEEESATLLLICETHNTLVC